MLRIDLLPHTEQVVFLIAGLFGIKRTFHVDIKNLRKIKTNQMPDNWRLFESVGIDKYQIWRDIQSGENVVLDRYGVWSEEGMFHVKIA